MDQSASAGSENKEGVDAVGEWTWTYTQLHTYHFLCTHTYDYSIHKTKTYKIQSVV